MGSLPPYSFLSNSLQGKKRNIFDVLADIGNHSGASLGGLSSKVAKLYMDFDIEPSRANGHDLAMKIAEKYIKEFKVPKKRGPSRRKWNDLFCLQFHMLVWIKKTKNGSSLREAILHATKELGTKDYEKKINSSNARYYEMLKSNSAVKRQEVTFQHFSKKDPAFLETLMAVYSERYTNSK